MKRSQEQHRYYKPSKFVPTRNITNMSKDEKHHIGGFLDLESKLQFSHVNKSRFQESKSDKDLQCLKSTNHFVGCSGVFQKMQVGQECLVFCKEHVNQVIETIVNIMFSGHIYTRYENGSIMKLPYPEITIQKSTPDDEEYEVFSIDVNDFDDMENNETIGQWATRHFDFKNENWFDMQIYFGDNLHEIFYNWQGIEWDLNYLDNMLSIQNLSFVEEYATDDEGDEVLNMEEPD
jgi:hypothetical protein